MPVRNVLILLRIGDQNPAHIFLDAQKLAHFSPIPFVIGIKRVLFRLQAFVFCIENCHIRQLFHAQGVKGFFAARCIAISCSCWAANLGDQLDFLY